MNWSFVSALITASIIGAWNVPLGAEAAVYGMAFGGCIVLCNSTAGAAVLQLFRIPQQARFYSLAFILGNVVVSVLLFAGAYLLSAPRILLAGGILLAAGAAAGRKGLRSVFPRSTPFEAAAVAVTAVAATLWSDTALFPLFELGQQTVLRPWIDIYIHAANLTIFKSGVAAKDFGAIYLAGTPLSFYHFASYQVGVLHGVFTGATALQTTAGMLTPYGVLCAGIAVFALFSAWRRPIDGLAATGAVLLLPDAAAYGLKCLWFSFHFFMEISPTLAQGVAAACCSIALCVLGSRYQHLGCWLAAVGIACATIVIKAHVAILLLPCVFLLAVAKLPSRRMKFGALLGAAVAIGAAAAIAAQLALAPPLRFELSGLNRYVPFLVNKITPGFTQEYYRAHWPQLSPFARVVQGALLIAGATYGPVLLAALFCFLIRLRKRFDLLEFAVIACACVQAMFAIGLAAGTYGDPFELRHRAFVLPYVLAAGLCGAHAVAWMYARVGNRKVLTAGLAASALLCLVSIRRAAIYLAPFSPSAWTAGFVLQRFDTALLAVTEYVRKNSNALDIAVFNRPEEIGVIAGMTERRDYLTREKLFAKHKTSSAEAAERRRKLDDFYAHGDLNAIHEFYRATGLRWIIAPGDAVPAVCAQFLTPVFAAGDPKIPSGRYLVYDLAQSSAAAQTK